MSDRPTPEVDAAEIDESHFSDWGIGPSGYVEADFARQLERQRDEARELAHDAWICATEDVGSEFFNVTSEKIAAMKGSK